jgi:sterol desaturase/sphingolipid hydroxylase (fatty acid hydroxylase superfamily)
MHGTAPITASRCFRVHHSVVRSETDSNYGTLFSFWDRLFGSYRGREDGHAIRFGIGAYEDPRWQRLRGLLELPLKSVRPVDANQAASQEAAP